LKNVFVFLCLLTSFLTEAQEKVNDIKTLSGYLVQNTIKLNYIPVDIQSGQVGREEIPMSVLGLHYDFTLNKNVYAGIGMFAAIKGDQGGLFTLGAEIGFQKQIYKNLYFDTDFHFGGGGGYRYLVKDGSFVNYNIGLKYKTPKIALGIQYSYFNFYNGYIKSTNVSGFVTIPTKLLFTDYEHANNTYQIDKKGGNYFWNRPASKNGVTLQFDHFMPTGSTKDQNLNPLTNTLYLLGFEYDHYINRNTFSYLHLDAVYKGLESGFMDLFLGIGYEPLQTKSLNLFTKFGIGSSGGRVEREGGFTIYPSIGLEQKIHKNLSLEIHGGYIMAPFGSFEAYTIGYGIKYNTYNSGAYHKELASKVIATTHGIRLSLQNQTYFQAISTETKPYDLQLIVVQINQDFSEHFYISGQAAFTYEGEAGGYADGMVGLGYYAPRIHNEKIEFNLEFLIGVSGGAKIDTGAGLAIKPKLGMNYVLSNKFHLTSSIGKIIAPFGNLNSTLLSFGISYNLTKLQIND
jgi:hypothetical protein